MFGLESKKKKGQKPVEETFDLEIDIADPAKCKVLKEKVDVQIQGLKQALRSGDQKDEFDQLGVLLHGYTALQKLITRLSKKR